MDTFITLTSLAVVILVPLGIVAGIRALAGGDDKPTDLATFLAPVAGAVLRLPTPSHPAIREDEPVRWNFGAVDFATPA
jgi:hypothetical protein